MNHANQKKNEATTFQLQSGFQHHSLPCWSWVLVLLAAPFYHWSHFVSFLVKMLTGSCNLRHLHNPATSRSQTKAPLLRKRWRIVFELCESATFEFGSNLTESRELSGQSASQILEIRNPVNKDTDGSIENDWENIKAFFPQGQSCVHKVGFNCTQSCHQGP